MKLQCILTLRYMTHIHDTCRIHRDTFEDTYLKPYLRPRLDERWGEKRATRTSLEVSVNLTKGGLVSVNTADCTICSTCPSHWGGTLNPRVRANGA